ncbi:MAG: hypothetical protein KGM24_09520 [Elusimicrobia bacterium]|nr:hypothetical protein [Elusimicrobiota bacterium]
MRGKLLVFLLAGTAILAGCASLTPEERRTACRAENTPTITYATYRPFRFSYPFTEFCHEYVSASPDRSECIPQNQALFHNACAKGNAAWFLKTELRALTELFNQEDAAGKQYQEQQQALQVVAAARQQEETTNNNPCSQGIAVWLNKDAPSAKYDHKCAYSVKGLTPMQKVKGGYLVVPAMNFFPAGSYADGYSPAMLYTETNLHNGQLLLGVADYVGRYKYTGINGFVQDVPAFRLMQKR